MQQCTVAVLCLLPDAGHVRPLLRLARLLHRHLNCRIVCFLPGTFEALVQEFGFEFRGIRSVSAPWQLDLAATLSRRSIFYNSFSSYIDLHDGYWTPLKDAASRELGSLIADLQGLGPQVVLGDSNVFSDWYERLASSCGARLLINEYEGNLRNLHREFVRTYGLRDRHAWVQPLVEAAGWLSGKWFRLWRVLRYPTRRRTVNALRAAAENRAALAFQDCPAARADTSYVTAGLAILEPRPRVRGEQLRTTDRVILPPTAEIGRADLPRDLEDWLAGQRDGGVVYVSFGTMVALSEQMVGELIRGLQDARVAVLWSLPATQHHLLSRHHLTTDFRIEKFVAQATLLASKKVGCFVTHGGAGGAQEAVVCGTPVLCVPFLWDQPYNGSILAMLKVGRTLSKRHITWRRVSREIREVLDNPVYAESARRYAGEVRRLQASQQQHERLRQLVGGNQRLAEPPVADHRVASTPARSLESSPAQR